MGHHLKCRCSLEVVVAHSAHSLPLLEVDCIVQDETALLGFAGEKQKQNNKTTIKRRKLNSFPLSAATSTQEY